MKGGGLTWLGWLMVGVGGMLMYAGMTNQSLVAELSAVLNGKSPKDGAQPAGGLGSSAGSAVGGVAGAVGGVADSVIPRTGTAVGGAVGGIAGAIGGIGAAVGGHAGTLPQPYYRGP